MKSCFASYVRAAFSGEGYKIQTTFDVLNAAGNSSVALLVTQGEKFGRKPDTSQDIRFEIGQDGELLGGQVFASHPHEGAIDPKPETNIKLKGLSLSGDGSASTFFFDAVVEKVVERPDDSGLAGRNIALAAEITDVAYRGHEKCLTPLGVMKADRVAPALNQ